MTESKPTIVAAIVPHDGRVLLVCRHKAEGDLRWQFPAGGQEPGESVEDAAVRECKEETGLPVVAQSVIGQRVHPQTGRTMAYVACAPAGAVGELTLGDTDDLSQVGWYSLAEAATMLPGVYGPVQKYLDLVAA